MGFVSWRKVLGALALCPIEGPMGLGVWTVALGISCCQMSLDLGHPIQPMESTSPGPDVQDFASIGTDWPGGLREDRNREQAAKKLWLR